MELSGLGNPSSWGGMVHTDEVFESDIGNGAAAAVALDHVHLVGGPGVDVAVGDVADVNVGGERAHGAATAPVAVDVLNQDALGGTLCRVSKERARGLCKNTYLDSDTLVLVGDLDLVIMSKCPTYPRRN